MLMMKSSGRKASIVYTVCVWQCWSVFSVVHPGAALRAHLLLGCSLRTWKERLSCLPSSLYYQSMHTAGCLYVRLKMTDNECATLPSRNQCESGNHNNSPLSPGVDMLDPAKLQHVVVSPTTFRMYLRPTRHHVVPIQKIVSPAVAI